MTLQNLKQRVRKKRYLYYTMGLLIVFGLTLSGAMGYVIYGSTDQGMMSLQSSLLLSFAVLLLMLVPTKDLKRIEILLDVAAKHNGILTMEILFKETGFPEAKLNTLLKWLIKNHMARKNDATGRLVFPDLKGSSAK